jgi:hypothetical protein
MTMTTNVRPADLEIGWHEIRTRFLAPRHAARSTFDARLSWCSTSRWLPSTAHQKASDQVHGGVSLGAPTPGGGLR